MSPETDFKTLSTNGAYYSGSTPSEQTSNFALLETIIRQERGASDQLLHESFIAAYFPWNKFYIGSVSFTALEHEKDGLRHPLFPLQTAPHIYSPIEERAESAGMNLVCEDFSVSEWDNQSETDRVKKRCIVHMKKVRTFLNDVMYNCHDIHLQLWQDSGDLHGTGKPKKPASHYTKLESIALDNFFTQGSGAVRNNPFVLCILMSDPCTEVLFLAENTGDRAVFLMSGEHTNHAAQM